MCSNVSLQWLCFYYSKRNITLVALDLDRPIAEQGPFDCILHKLSDVWSKTEYGDEKAMRRWKNMQVGENRAHLSTFVSVFHCHEGTTLKCGSLKGDYHANTKRVQGDCLWENIRGTEF